MPGRDSAVTAALWLVELQRVAVRGSHAIKNALNNVAVNLEVVRGRAHRADVAGAVLSRFAESAAGQLDAVTMLSEALLALTRPPREPVDVRATAMAIHALLREGRMGGEGLKNGTLYEGPATTGVSGVTVRLALAHLLVPAADDEPPAEWCVEMSNGAGPAALRSRSRGLPRRREWMATWRRSCGPPACASIRNPACSPCAFRRSGPDP